MSPLFPEETGQSDQLICEMQFSLPEGEIKLTSVVHGYISTAVTSQSRLTVDSFNSLFGNGLSKTIKRRHWHVTEEKRSSWISLEEMETESATFIVPNDMLLKHTSGTIMSLVVLRRPQCGRVCGCVEAEHANKIKKIDLFAISVLQGVLIHNLFPQNEKNSMPSAASHHGKLNLLITYTISLLILGHSLPFQI